jgi:hypothetical protein
VGPFILGGTVVAIAGDAYGPAVIAGITYQSADAAATTPLAQATVVVGPVPIVGPTAPAALPSGDVAVTTGPGGVFAASLAVAPAPPSSDEPFVLPENNVTNFVVPAAGYYVQVFGPGTDGRSAGRPIPLHQFFAPSTSLVLRVSTPSAAEAGALVTVNDDRATNNAAPLTFDESAEEAARLHASDESTAGYTCHYDTHNVGPTSRYLAVGGMGLVGESLALVAGPMGAAFGFADAAFMAEKSDVPVGGHFLNNIDPAHEWAGLAALPFAPSPDFVSVDYEFVTPSGQDLIVGASGYIVSSTCPPSTAGNDS